MLISSNASFQIQLVVAMLFIIAESILVTISTDIRDNGFVVQGFALVLFFYLVLFALSLLISIPHWFSDSYKMKDLYSWLMDKTILSYPVFFVLSLVIASFMAYVAGDVAKRAIKNEETRHAAYREMAAMDGVESLLP